MKRISLLLPLCLLLACNSGNSTNSENNSSNMKAPVAESKQRRLPTIDQKILKLADGENLRYTIRLPGEYSSDKPVPLIVALHYGYRGRTPQPWYGRGMIEALVEPALSELDAIVIAPDSLGGGWNTKRNDSAVIELMDHIEKNYSIDKQRTLLMGFSMGGHGTFHFGGHHQDRFRAAIPIAARPSTTTEWKIPLYVIHSKADEVVKIGPTQAYVEKIKAAGADVTFAVVDDLPHFQTPRFAEPLKEAIPWIKKVWAR